MSIEVPESMIEEFTFQHKNDHVPLKMWIGFEGNYKLAVGYTALFWPQFETVGKYVLVAGTSEENVAEWETQPDVSERDLEAVLNHIHLADFHWNDEETLSPDKLLFLGQTLQEIYEAKLRWQFPERTFSVEFIVPADPEDLQHYQLTFWQKKWE